MRSEMENSRFTSVRSWLSRAFGRLIASLREVLKVLASRLGILRRYYIPIDYKFAIAIALVIGGSMGALGYTILRNQRTLMDEQVHRMGSVAAGQLAESAREPLLASDELRLELLVRSLSEEEGVLGTGVLDVEGLQVASLGLLPALDVFSGREASGPGTWTIDWTRPEEEGPGAATVTFVRDIHLGGTPVGYALVSFDGANINAAMLRSRSAILSATVVMVLFGLGMSVFVGRRLSRPIHDLIQASEALDEGDLSYRFKGQRRDEIGRLMSSFNTMAEGLLAKQQVEDIFSRYVPSGVAEKILSDLSEVKLGGRRVVGSVLFADIAGFTALSEEMEPDEVAALINDYFSLIPRVAACY